jgi:hypothetical protein
MGPAAGARRRGQASTSLEANDPMVTMRAVEAGFANLASAFGGPFIPAITSGLQDLANVLNWTAKLDKTYTDKDGKQVVWDDTNPLFPRGDAREALRICPFTTRKMANSKTQRLLASH